MSEGKYKTDGGFLVMEVDESPENPREWDNLGELYNLCISSGTLTTEERFKIQEHVQMTIIMLEELPFPEYLKNVPIFAGAHHETLIGTG